jgi:3D (Asp-Asp-Asp) domain-containing protein
MGAVAALALTAGCTTRGGTDWVHDAGSEPRLARGGSGWIHEPAPSDGRRGAPDGDAAGARPADERTKPAPVDAAVVVREHGSAAPRGAGAERLDPGLFRNTYYDFPREGAGAREALLYDAACAPIAHVARSFHDQVCVQGSGRLASGETVSFARRGCGCADLCPRTGQQVCFERLDPRQFPYGRGATGRPITPLRTVAVDSTVIPLGTRLYIPELVGLPLPDGGLHDGCFVAEDRGIKVVGRQIDVFTGDPEVTSRLNAVFPSNRGVHVRLRDARCGAASLGPGAS